MVQGIGFLSGIFILRYLSTKEYALYTLANTMLGTMNMLSDGGISLGVMSEGGKVWTDKSRLGIVLNTGLYLRKKFSILTFSVTMPILVYLLYHHGASINMCILISISIVPIFFSLLSGKVYEILPRLHQDIYPLQKIDVQNNILRLFISTLFIFLYPFAFVAIISSGLPQIVKNKQLKLLAKKVAHETNVIDDKVRKNILNTVKRVFPDALYYSLSGQISIWVISLFGSTSSIAQIGALSRLGIMLGTVGIVFTTLFSPRFARLDNYYYVLKKNFYILISLLFVVCAIILVIVYFFSPLILKILGKNYMGLEYELFLTMLGSCLTLISSVIFNIGSSRGWAINPLISIPISILSIIISSFFLKIGTLKGILYLNITTALVSVLLHSIYNLTKIYSLRILK